MFFNIFRYEKHFSDSGAREILDASGLAGLCHQFFTENFHIIYYLFNPNFSTKNSLILYLRTLPAAFIGNPSTNSMYLGTL